MPSLIIHNLSKTYSNGVRALKNISLEVPTGMFGLLGPNGAGKSTLMRTIATLQEADEGAITFGNLDVLNQRNKARRILGYLPQQFGLYPKISAQMLLNHLAVLKGLNNRAVRKEIVKRLLHKTNLYNDRNKKLGTFSGGMKQRFGIAQALLADPKLIIVDEPTAGLDPAERNRFHNLLCELGENTIVILSTHIVEDVKELCTNMAIINRGEVLLSGGPQETINEVSGHIYRKKVKRDHIGAYKSAYRVISERLSLGEPVIHIYSESNPGNGFEPMEADLSDVYFSKISKN